MTTQHEQTFLLKNKHASTRYVQQSPGYSCCTSIIKDSKSWPLCLLVCDSALTARFYHGYIYRALHREKHVHGLQRKNFELVGHHKPNTDLPCIDTHSTQLI